MINTYHDFEKEDLFGKNNQEEKIIQLSWIVNALLKTENTKALDVYIEQLHDALFDFNKLFYDKYVWLYYQSKVMALAFSGKYMEGLPYNTGIFMFVYMNLISLNF